MPVSEKERERERKRVFEGPSCWVTEFVTCSREREYWEARARVMVVRERERLG